MRTLKIISTHICIFSLSAIMISFFPLTSMAEKMDMETQNNLVDRLDRVLDRLDSNNPSWVSTHIRLADVLAERARSRFMLEVEEGCSGCKGSVDDRDKSIKLYEKVIQKADHYSKGVILSQLSQLYIIKNDPKKAKYYLFQIINQTKTPYEESRVARANEALADLFYKEKNYSVAYKHFQLALKSKSNPHKGYLKYRSAWCQFNLGELKNATLQLEKVLSQPSLLVRPGTEGAKYDPIFHSDVVTDLAIFYARAPVGNREVSKYRKFLPQGKEKELLLIFANETDRVGSLGASLLIMQSYVSLELTEVEKLDAQMRLAHIAYAMNKTSLAIQKFEDVAKTWIEKGCSDPDKCEQLHVRMKNFVIEFHKSKKIDLDLGVLKAYETYTSVFKDDSGMALTGGQIARELKKYNSAMNLFHISAVAAFNQIEKGPSSHPESNDGKVSKSKKDDKDDAESVSKLKKNLDKALDGEIEIAELVSNLDYRERAYLFFLKLKPNDPKAYSVRYQLAHVAYERKEFLKAAAAFKILALEVTHEKSLKKQSADLALESLAVMKKDIDIESWALEFAKVFPKNRNEFSKISRNASLNLVAGVINNKSSSQSELKEALSRLTRIAMDGATDEEKIKIYKNQFLLGRRIPDLSTAQSAISQMLKVKKLSDADREEALGRSVWISEMKFEFREAYLTSKKMKFTKLGQNEKEMRLATLADLGGISSSIAHYQNYLKSSPSNFKSAVVRAHLVEISNYPVQELQKQKKYLMSFPGLIGDLLIVIFNKTKDEKIIRSYLKISAIANSSSGRLLISNLNKKDIISFSQRISNHQLSTHNDFLLQKSIKLRMSMLAQADKLLKTFSSEATTQLMAFSIIERENNRLFKEIMSLPPPRRLNSKELEEYNKMLELQASGFKQKAIVAEAKIKEIWFQSKLEEIYSKNLENSSKKIRPIYIKEIQLMSIVATDDLKDSLNSLLKRIDEIPSKQELASVKERARKEPYDVDEIEKLKKLESKVGNDVMVTYLDARVKSLKTQEKL